MIAKTKVDAAGDCIWLVQGHFSPVNTRGWRPFEAFDRDDSSLPATIEAMQLTMTGRLLPAERFPIDNYPMRGTSEHRKRILQLFSNGFFFMRSESATVLRRFDLGEGALYPARLWHPDRTTPVPGEYFYLSQGNRKDAFLPERSPEARPLPNKKRWPPSNPTHGQVVFSTKALDGPDIWWDDKIDAYYFISDRLAKALKQAKLVRDWMLLRCPIVTPTHSMK